MAPGRVVFRFEAGPTVGLGHAMRCLAVAEAFRDEGWSCAAATTRASASFLAGSIPAWLEVDRIDSSPEAARGDPGLGKAGSDLLVVDGYEFDAALESRARDRAARVVAIDDTPSRRHDCDVLLDTAACRKDSDYEGLVPRACLLLLGPRYVPLRKDFASRREASLARSRREGRRLFVAFGGGDVEGWAARILEELGRARCDVIAEVVVNATSVSYPVTAKAAERMEGRARLHSNPASVADLMVSCDVAIGAAGVSAWERCCLGLPALIVVTATNQAENAAAMERAGAGRIVDARFDWGRLPSWSASVDLEAMSSAAARLCDGLGALRVVAAVTQRVPSRLVTLRTADQEDCRTVWRINNDAEVRRNSLSPEDIPFDDHAAWFSRILLDPQRWLAVVDVDSEPAGTIRLDARSGDPVVSIALDGRWRGRGVGVAAIRSAVAEGTKRFGERPVRAVIQTGNGSSRAAFEKAGFRLDVGGNEETVTYTWG